MKKKLEGKDQVTPWEGYLQKKKDKKKQKKSERKEVRFLYPGCIARTIDSSHSSTSFLLNSALRPQCSVLKCPSVSGRGRGRAQRRRPSFRRGSQ